MNLILSLVQVITEHLESCTPGQDWANRPISKAISAYIDVAPDIVVFRGDIEYKLRYWARYSLLSDVLYCFDF